MDCHGRSETPPQSLGPAFNSLGRALQATWWTHWGPFSETPTRSLTRPRCLPPNSIDVTEFPGVKSCLGLCRILGGQGGDNICENIRGLRTKGHDYWNMGCLGTRCRNAAEGLSLRCRSPSALEVKVQGGDGEAPLPSSGQRDVGESAADVFRTRRRRRKRC